MSYSFSVQAEDKGALLAAVAVKFDEIVAQQPMHSQDRAHVTQMVADQAAMLDLPRPGEIYVANVNGYLGWRGDEEGKPTAFTGYSAAASVSLTRLQIPEHHPV